MRLNILSDLHLEFGMKAPEPTDADVVILAGDIHVGRAGWEWARQTFAGRPVIYVLGNHEFYHHNIPGLTQSLQRENNGSSVHLLENEAVQIGGFTFLGCTLWTDFRVWPDQEAAMLVAGQRMRDFTIIRTGGGKRMFRPWDVVELYESSVAWLYQEMSKHDPSKTIVITHHGPSRRSIPPQHAGNPLNAAFLSDLDEIVEGSGVRLWVHGHTHHNVDYHIGRTRILTNQRGYPGEAVPGFEPGLVVEV